MLRVALLLAAAARVADAQPAVLEAPRLEALAQPSRLVVLFHSPHCGHCAAMMPAWTEAASSIPNVRFAMVDATEEKDIASTLQVNGYPTLLSIETSDVVVEYSGDRTAESIRQFAARPPPSFLGFSERRRGVVDRPTGELRASLLDSLAQGPHEASEILKFAAETSVLGGTLLACCLLLAGGLIAAVSVPASPPQFVYVEYPEGVQPGQSFIVEFDAATSPRPVSRASSSSRGKSFAQPGLAAPAVAAQRRDEEQGPQSVITVQAPTGVRPGDTFLVPLVANAPVARACGAPAARATSRGEGGSTVKEE